jgi:tRNA (guanine6-N2)-methyltransferase
VTVRSVRGLEWVAAAEIGRRIPAARAITVSPRQVTLRLSGPIAGLLDLRTVDDVFLDVGALAGVGTTRDVPPELARRVARLDWPGSLARLAEVRTLPGRPHFDVVTSIEGRRNYNRFAVENAVGSALAPLLRATHLARTAEGRAAGADQAAQPDLTVRVFLRGTEAIAALRLAARPLHRRGYKQDTGPGTLHPPVAAALALLAEPATGATVADPFCGDGTIAIETALSHPDAHVLAGDIDAGRLEHARRNASRAGVRVDFAQADAGGLTRPAAGLDAILTNPPWNLAVDAAGLLSRSLDRFWRRVPELMTASGLLCTVTDLELGAPGRLHALGYRLALSTQVRLAGRVSHLLLAAPSGHAAVRLPADLAHWRRRAVEAGVVTEQGF